MELRFAFNDMLGKGFDSAKQESFAWQRFSEGDEQFWWVPHVHEKWGHAPDWEKHKRDNKGRYKVFPKSPISDSSKDKEVKSEVTKKLLRLATFFPVADAAKAQELINLAFEFE